MAPISACLRNIEDIAVEGGTVAYSVGVEELDLDAVVRSIRANGRGNGCGLEAYFVGADFYCGATS
jgi:hypothetical protein